MQANAFCSLQIANGVIKEQLQQQTKLISDEILVGHGKYKTVNKTEMNAFLPFSEG